MPQRYGDGRRQERHSGNGTDTKNGNEQQPFGNRFGAIDRQNHQCGRSRKAVHQSDEQCPARKSPHMGMLVRFCIVYRFGTVPMSMNMPLATFVFVYMKVNSISNHRSGDVDAERYQHKANAELQQLGDCRRNSRIREHDKRADREQRQGVPKSPHDSVAYAATNRFGRYDD